MTSKAEVLSVFESYYSQWETSPERMQSGYDYERTFVEMMQKVQQEVFQRSVGSVPKNKNSKKNFSAVWEK
jgi:hypothetical protein